MSVGHLSDVELERRLKELVGIERKSLVLLLAHLGEFDERRLHSDRGHESLFYYCMRVLGYSEQAAYKRIRAARAARAYPEIYRRLAAGETNLTVIVALAAHFSADNVVELLDAARGKRTLEIEALAASFSPRPDSPDFIRALPATDDALIEPLSERRFLFRLTAGSEFLAKYKRAKELLGVKGGASMAAVIESGFDAVLNRLDPARRIERRTARAARAASTRGASTRGADAGAGSQPSDALDLFFPAAGPAAGPVGGPPESRAIAAALRDEVWQRDAGRCTFMTSDGDRCLATGGLEIDHIRPFALGGPSDVAANLRLMCRTHNQLLARRIFGAAAGPRRSKPR